MTEQILSNDQIIGNVSSKRISYFVDNMLYLLQPENVQC
jgi:hypothetical protein